MFNTLSTVPIPPICILLYFSVICDVEDDTLVGQLITHFPVMKKITSWASFGIENRHRGDAESATGVAKKHMSGSKSRRHLGFARAGEMAPGLRREPHFHRK